VEKALKIGVTVDQVDLIEIQEALPCRHWLTAG
jgi:hypothetical protein